MSTMNDDRFLDEVARDLIGLPAVEAVALGGSRAQATQRANSDWDFAIYYRDRFDPHAPRPRSRGCGIGGRRLGRWCVQRRRVADHRRPIRGRPLP
ncbi:hypothetical protein FRAHR75_720022 [Frankia sp. Hr75.2]|nr:hypothetical protein FRAHR75_720022 [Frankia sp. Hr75.2]